MLPLRMYQHYCFYLFLLFYFERDHDSLHIFRMYFLKLRAVSVKQDQKVIFLQKKKVIKVINLHGNVNMGMTQNET